jgi:putative Holliday junction resolvase
MTPEDERSTKTPGIIPAFTARLRTLSSAMPICNLPELPALLKKGQCLLGIDPGSTVIGLAISDPGLMVASPLASLTRKKFSADAASILKIVRERNVGGIVVGLPKNMDGSEGPAAQSARAFARNLEKFLGGELSLTRDQPIPLPSREGLGEGAIRNSAVEDCGTPPPLTPPARGGGLHRASPNDISQKPVSSGGFPIAFWDERMSSAAVERFLIQDDMSRKRRDAVIDKAAAAYILQGALDRLRASRG